MHMQAYCSIMSQLGASQSQVLGCNCRNRQVTAFYDVVEYFRPAYVLMENVLDILKKEDGTYAKSAMASLLTMRYQVRIGVIAACDQGVPQSRNRCAPACFQHHTVVAVNCSCCPVSDDGTQHLMRKRVDLLLFFVVFWSSQCDS